MKILLTLVAVAGLAFASLGCGDSAAPKPSAPPANPDAKSKDMTPKFDQDKMESMKKKAAEEEKKDADKDADKDGDKDADKDGEK